MEKNNNAGQKDKLSLENQEPIQVDDSVIHKFLDNQNKQIELQAIETKLREKEIANSHEYAKEALKLQAKFLTDEGSNKRKTLVYTFIFIGIVFFGLLSLIGVMVYLNKEAMAMELIKFLTSTSLGAIGGYFYGRSKSSKVTDSEYVNYDEEI